MPDDTNPSQPVTQEDVAAVPRVVEAVFTSANTGELVQGGGKSPLAKMIEAAMAQAVEYAYSNGINDPEKVRELMQLARAEVKKLYAAAVEKAMAEMK